MFDIKLGSPVPIFMQIVDQTKEAILTGLLVEGDQMPSIRKMATDLMINQSTVTRAYNELEHQGIIMTVPGRGTFISLDEEKIDVKKNEMVKKLKSVLKEAMFYNITKEELIEMYEELEDGDDTTSR